MHSLGRPIKIFSAGLLTTDVMVPIGHMDFPITEWMASNGILHKDKVPISREQHDACVDMIRRHVREEPAERQGGSAANMLVTAKRLLGDKLQVTFKGIAGNDKRGRAIKAALAEAGIDFQEHIPTGKVGEAVTSFVFKYPALANSEETKSNGDRTVALYLGNARELLQPDQVTLDDIKNNDVVLLEGNLWKRLQVTRPNDYGFAEDHHLGFADKLLNLRWENNKTLWLAMPTDTKLGEEKAEHFRWLNHSANLILGNENELARVYTQPDEFKKIHARIKAVGIDEDNLDSPEQRPFRKKNAFETRLRENLSADEFGEFDYWNRTINPEEGFKRLQLALAKKTLEKQNSQGNWNGSTEQMGFITRDRQGAVVVTAEGIKTINAVPVEESAIVNKLGAGDTASGVFAALNTQNIPVEQAAEAAMHVTADKLKIDDGRHPDPLDVLRDTMPRLAAELERNQGRDTAAAVGPG